MFVSYIQISVPIRLWLDQVFFLLRCFPWLFFNHLSLPSSNDDNHLFPKHVHPKPFLNYLQTATTRISPFACIYFITRPCFPFIFAVIEYRTVNLSPCFSLKSKKYYYRHLARVGSLIAAICNSPVTCGLLSKNLLPNIVIFSWNRIFFRFFNDSL